MVRRLLVLVLLLSPAPSLAQQPAAPVPLYPGAAPRSIEPEPLPPLDPGAAQRPTARPAEPPAPEAASGPSAERVFCNQPVTVHVAGRDSVPERYRGFIGVWSDASWTPQLCAALIVENVTADGTATIVYVFGPMGGGRGPGTILHGTGVIRDGELRFQNSDGSQFAFRPLYADLTGTLTTPKGQTYSAVFKQTP